MLQKSLLFLHTADEDKSYNEEVELNSIKTLPLSDISAVFSICLLVSILGLFGNGIICLLITCTIKKTKFTVYVANLAAGDFLAQLRSFLSFLEFFIPFFINARTRHLMLMMFFFGHKTNSYFLAAMSTERCLTVFSPVWYQSHRPKCSTVFVCAFLWALSVMESMLDHFLCTQKYIITFNIGTFACQVLTVYTYIIAFIILTPCMVFSILALFIRIKRKPQQGLPARLDISILVTVVLHVILSPTSEIISWIVFSTAFNHYLKFYYVTLIFYCLGSSVNPLVYLLVGCWKREKGQEPLYKFLERALEDERKDTMRTEPDQEQA